jgi:hypothetical protein
VATGVEVNDTGRGNVQDKKPNHYSRSHLCAAITHSRS